MSDLIDRQSVLNAFDYWVKSPMLNYTNGLVRLREMFEELPPVNQTQCLTDDDKETIRIHLGAFKEELCNQHRWDEAKEYEGIIDRLMHLPPVKPEQKMGRWIEREDAFGDTFYNCSACGEMWSTIDGNPWDNGMDYCPNCGAKMEVEE